MGSWFKGAFHCGGEVMEKEHEADAHTGSAARKKREMTAGAQLINPLNGAACTQMYPPT